MRAAREERERSASAELPVFRAVVAYPGVMPAITEVARAFLETGMLARYETTFTYDGQGRVARLLRRSTGLGQRVDRELSRRELPFIPRERVHGAPGWELVRTAARVLGAGDVLMDGLWERMITRFDAGVARRLEPDVNLVYGYEHACCDTFRRAQELGIRRVFDMSAPHYSVTQALHAEQFEAFPELVTDHWRSTRPLSAARNARKQAELDTANLVVANSRYTARTLEHSGYPAGKIRVVPYGAPPIDDAWRRDRPAKTVRLLYAGPVSVRKGAHHLLTAFRELGVRSGAELVLAGKWTLPEHLRQDLPGAVRALGSVPQRTLFELYRSSSVLVFPTLADGFGMVATEAFAHGLPVITTRNAGAADLIEEGVNGWVLEPGDVGALVARLAFCIDHPDALYAMREAAEATAAHNQWSDYRRRIIGTLCDVLAHRGGASEDR